MVDIFTDKDMRQQAGAGDALIYRSRGQITADYPFVILPGILGPLEAVNLQNGLLVFQLIGDLMANTLQPCNIFLRLYDNLLHRKMIRKGQTTRMVLSFTALEGRDFFSGRPHCFLPGLAVSISKGRLI